MHLASRAAFAATFGVVSLVAGNALADGPCGTFDLSGSLDCKVKVSADCNASCGVDKLEASCSGHCTAAADTKCSKDDCGTKCIAECDPSLLDCFGGCHAECDQPAIASEASSPERRIESFAKPGQCRYWKWTFSPAGNIRSACIWRRLATPLSATGNTAPLQMRTLD